MTNRLGARVDRLEGHEFDDEDGDCLFIHVGEGEQDGPEVKAARVRANALDVLLLVLRTPVPRNPIHRWNSHTPPGVAVPLSQLDHELLDVAIECISERLGMSNPNKENTHDKLTTE